MRWFMYTGYWPFGFYVLAWPTLFLFGISKTSVLSSNLLLLFFLLYLLYKMHREAPNDRVFPLLFRHVRVELIVQSLQRASAFRFSFLDGIVVNLSFRRFFVRPKGQR